MSKALPVHSPPKRLVVSACLTGRACRYDGASKGAEPVQLLLAEWEARGAEAVLVCPEEMGKLGTPRPAAELRGGDGFSVLDGTARVAVVESGKDITGAFLAGAHSALEAAGNQADGAILKARSPSCGCVQTWIDGTVSPGSGVFSALLQSREIPVWTEETPGLAEHVLPLLEGPRDDGLG